MRKYYFLLIFVFILFSGVLVFATSKEDITFPVAELGNCKSEEACEAFCDLPENMGPCLNFAEIHNLIPKEEIEIGKKILALGETSGPGGCRGVVECGTYCDDMSHIKECVAFAEKNNLMSADELAEAKKVASALEKGVQPPPCNSKSECDDVCILPENMKTCITFAKEAGLMPPEELAEAEMVLAALEKGITPPPCGSKDKCDEYCSLPENFETCVSFAEAAGFMSPEEAEMVRRTGGKGPGDCRGKEACEAFCEDPANMGPCVDFAVENGFMSAEEAEQVRKMMAAGFTSGPGGCKGQEECEAFCDDISHMAECVDFAERTGMMSSEDAARARRMAEMGISGGPGGCKGEEECRAFCENPANMETCLNFAIQVGDMSPEEAEQMRQGKQRMAQTGEGLAMPCSEAFACLGNLSQGEPMEQEEPAGGGGQNPEIQAKIKSCTQKLMPEGMPSEGFEPPEGAGPSQEEIERMIQRETQRQMEAAQQQMQQQVQQQIEQQMQQQTETPPQSFFDQVKNFLAGLI